MLADPGLVEAEPVEPLHQLEVAVDAGGGVLVHRVERRQEDAVAELDHGMAASGTERRHCARHATAPQGGGVAPRSSRRYGPTMDTTLDRPWTTESFLAWEDRQEFKYEFDGQRVIPMTGGSLAHQRIVFNLCLALMGLLGERPLLAVQEMRLRIGATDPLSGCRDLRRPA